MKDESKYQTDYCSNTQDETSAHLKESSSDVDDTLYSPFKIGKNMISNLMNLYLTKKFTEDIDFLNNQGGTLY
jgi:hypothetical protein